VEPDAGASSDYTYDEAHDVVGARGARPADAGPSRAPAPDPGSEPGGDLGGDLGGDEAHDFR
jgi:hypothetical protein